MAQDKFDPSKELSEKFRLAFNAAGQLKQVGMECIMCATSMNQPLACFRSTKTAKSLRDRLNSTFSKEIRPRINRGKRKHP